MLHGVSKQQRCTVSTFGLDNFTLVLVLVSLLACNLQPYCMQCQCNTAQACPAWTANDRQSIVWHLPDMYVFILPVFHRYTEGQTELFDSTIKSIWAGPLSTNTFPPSPPPGFRSGSEDAAAVESTPARPRLSQLQCIRRHGRSWPLHSL